MYSFKSDSREATSLLILPLVHDLSQLTNQKELKPRERSLLRAARSKDNKIINNSAAGVSLSAEGKVDVEVAVALSIWCIRIA